MKFFLVSGLNDKGRKVQYKGVRERGKFEVRVFQLRTNAISSQHKTEFL